ncbi:MAG: hypothetical protein NC299_05765 [Lachnospiraceae bacterium]|nr:hypothetical protein [Ruminococcus sp.]MCM1274858.1 hypothetical protein [Lachnospiraceae bacterium]
MDKDEFVVDIDAYVDRVDRVDRSEKPKRASLPLRVRLTVLWSLLFGIFVGFPYIGLMAWLGDDFGAGAVVVAAAVFLCAHVTASALTFRRFSRKYHVRAWEFMLLSALPLLALGVALAAAAYIIGGWNGVGLFIFALCYGGYAVLYAALLSVALLCMRKFSRKSA